MEKMRNAYGKYERKTPLGRPRCRWKYDIKMYLVYMGAGITQSV
jgi:hypothetical protein